MLVSAKSVGIAAIAGLFLGTFISAAAELPEGCSKEIHALGGQNAVYRPADKAADTWAELKQLLFEKRKDGTPNKTMPALLELLKQKGFSATSSDIEAAIERDGPVRIERDTVFEWMALRYKGASELTAAEDVCWKGKKSFRAWKLSLKADDGKVHDFVIPVECLNLAKLRQPWCSIKIEPDCEHSTAKVTFDWTPKLKLDFDKTTRERISGPADDTRGHHEANIKLAEGTPVNLEVEVRREGDTATCSATVTSCKKDCPPDPKTCKTSCNLELRATWQDQLATIQVFKDGKTVDSCEGVAIKINDVEQHPNGPNCTVAADYEGTVTASYQSQAGAGGCTANCAATLVLKRPPPPPCCEKDWLVRGSALYSRPLGSPSKIGVGTGLYTHIDTEGGPGLGLEAEYLITGGEEPGWPSSGWSLPIGVTYSELRYSYMRDILEGGQMTWIMDQENTSSWLIYTGLRHRWQLGEKAQLSLGPLIGAFRSADVSFASLGHLTDDIDFIWSFAYGVDLTFDWRIGECWGLSTGATYLKADARDSVDVEIDPLVVRFGWVSRF